MSPENLSRRAMMAGAATLPAIAAIPTIAAAGANPDAELIALGEELRILQPAYRASIVEMNEKAGQAMRLVWERTGHRTPGPTQESIAIFAAVTKKADEETGADVADRNYELLCDQTGTLAEKIMAISAHTMAGVRAKTIAAIQCGGHLLWNEPFADLDWQDNGARSLIEAVCTVVGLDVPAEQLDEAVQS